MSEAWQDEAPANRRSGEPPTIDGRLDGVSDGCAVGWAWYPGDASRQLYIVAVVDGRTVGSDVADRHQGSSAAGAGDGKHEFAVALPESLADGGTHTLQVLAGPGRVPLAASSGFSVSVQETNPFARTAFRPIDQRNGAQAHAAADAPGPRFPRPWKAVPARLAARAVPARSAAAWLLGTGCAFYFVLLLYLSRHFGFFQDEWEFLVDRRGWTANAFLRPHVQSLLLIPAVVYKLLFVTVGIQTTWPYRIPVFALHLACVAGLYVLARRRAGAWLALIPAGLLLVLGAGWEDELWAFQMSFLASIAAGIWALICLDRGDRRGDIWASVLVAVSLASSSIGLPFTVGIGVEVLLGFRRRLWIVGIPLLLYLLWYLHYGQSDVVWANAVHVPSYDVQIGAYGFAGLLGLSSSVYGIGGATLAVGILLLAVSAVWLVRRLVREWPFPAPAATGVAAALALWTATALARAQRGQPYSSQYVYPSAVFILLSAIGFMRWRRISIRVALAIVAAGAVIAVAGVRSLRQYAHDRDSVDARVGVAFGAAQLAGRAGDPASYPDHGHLPYVTLGAYTKLVHDLGSPALTVAQIQQQPAGYTLLADRVLINVERIGPVAAGPRRPAGGPCSRPAPARALAVTLQPGQALYARAPGNKTLRLWIRRLSRTFPIPPRATLAPGSAVMLTLPHDASSIPWHVQVAESQPASPAASSAPARGCVAIIGPTA